MEGGRSAEDQEAVEVKELLEDGDDIDAETMVGGVEIADEESAEVCINEVAKTLELESAEQEYGLEGRDGEELDHMKNEGELDEKELKEARKEEVDFMEGRKIWSLRTIDECWKVTGKAPVSVRWVDVLKVTGRQGLQGRR